MLGIKDDPEKGKKMVIDEQFREDYVLKKLYISGF